MWAVFFFFFFFLNLFSLITVSTSQRDTVWECRRTESLKQNKLKYGTFFFFFFLFLAFRKEKPNHSSSVAAKRFQCDLKPGILERGQFN